MPAPVAFNKETKSSESTSSPKAYKCAGHRGVLRVYVIRQTLALSESATGRNSPAAATNTLSVASPDEKLEFCISVVFLFNCCCYVENKLSLSHLKLGL